MSCDLPLDVVHDIVVSCKIMLFFNDATLLKHVFSKQFLVVSSSLSIVKANEALLFTAQ